MDDTAEPVALVGGVAEGLVVVANDGLGDEGREVVGVVPAHTLNSDGNVGGGDGVVADTDVGANEVGLLLGQEVGAGLGGLGGQAGELLLGHLDELLVGDTAGTDKDHAVSGVVILDVVDELGPGDVADVLAGAKNGAAEGLVLVGGGVQVVEDNLLHLLLDLLSLAEDDITLPLDGALLELGVLKNVLQDVDALGNILVQGLGEVDGILALLLELVAHRGPDAIGRKTNRGVGVEVGAHVLNLELQLLLCPLGGALSGEKALSVRIFIPASLWII